MATRPAVLVYQEYASLSVPVADPELPVCLIGPAFQIVDFPEEVTSLADGTPITPFSYGIADSGLAPPPEPIGIPAYPGLLPGAKVDLASVSVFALNARVLVAHQLNLTTAPGNVLQLGVSPSSRGIAVGDICILNDGTHSIKRYVTDVTSVANQVTFSDDYPTSNWMHSSAISAQFERALPGAWQLPSNRVSPGPNSILLLPGINLGARPLPLISALLAVAYRALRTDLAKFSTMDDFRVSSAGLLGSVGKIDPRNPLAVGLFIASQNSNTPIGFFGVQSDDVIGYTAAKSALSSSKDLYAIALLSKDPGIARTFAAEFLTASDPAIALSTGVGQRFRMAFGYAGPLPLTRPLVARQTADSLSNNGVLTQAVGANFVDSGVIVGDLVRFFDVSGNVSETRLIASVNSNQRLTLFNQSPLLPNSTTTYDVVRDISADKDSQVSVLISAAQPGNRRLVLCWPDLAVVSGLTDGSKPRAPDGSKLPADPQPGFYLAAGVAAMVAAQPSHQGFTNLPINGFKTLLSVAPYFSDRQLAALSSAGLYVFTQDTEAQAPYCIHSLTTDVSTLEFGELMAVKNFDFVSLALRAAISHFVGPWNLTPEALDFMRTGATAELDSLRADKRAKIGARLLSGKVTVLQVSDISTDRAELYVVCTFPKPLNTIGLHIVSG